MMSVVTPTSPDVSSPPKFYQSLAGAVTWSQDTGLCLHLRLPTYWPPHPATIATARADIVTSREPGRYNPRPDTLASAGWDATDGRPSDGQSAGHNREAERGTLLRLSADREQLRAHPFPMSVVLSVVRAPQAQPSPDPGSLSGPGLR